MYHRISNYSSLELAQGIFSEFDIGISQLNFEKQIRHLKKNYTVLSFPEVLSCLEVKKPVPPNTVIITFDDGYMDSYTNAFPILKHYSIPATIFLATHMIEHPGLFWWDEITEIVRATLVKEFDTMELQNILEKIIVLPNPIRIESSVEKINFIEQMVRCLRSLPDLIHIQAIKLLREKLFPQGKEPYKNLHTSLLLTWSNIHEMETQGISFGLHSRYHENLSFMTIEEIAKMTRASKELIEQKIKHPLPVFVYPSGNKPNQYESVRKILIENGFKCALTDRFGIANIHNHDLYSLPRISLCNKGVAFLEKQFYTAYNYFLRKQEKQK